MFDTAYFTTRLYEQVKAMGESPTVLIHLYSGESFALVRVEEAAEGYVSILAYMSAETDLGDRGDWEKALDRGDPPFYCDRAAIAYAAISHVLVTPAQKGRGGKEIGFMPAGAEPGARKRAV